MKTQILSDVRPPQSGVLRDEGELWGSFVEMPLEALQEEPVCLSAHSRAWELLLGLLTRSYSCRHGRRLKDVVRH